MKATNDIRYLKRQDIDTHRWDACIEKASNSLIYGLHFYLDHMADSQWDALVLDDYKAVMPLPWRKKFGITYTYQPPFTQQLGIFTTTQTTGFTEAFLNQLPAHFRFAEIFLNHANTTPTAKAHINYILPLDAPYDQLAARYKKDLVRNLKLAATADLSYQKDYPLAPALDGYRREYAPRTPHLKEKDFRNFGQLCTWMQQRRQLLIRAVTGKDQQPLATALLFRDDRRLYLLQSTTPQRGRENKANHFLLDMLVREWADSGLTLDFEGSDIPGIAHFYENFGGRNQPYFFYRHNSLSWPVRLIKG